MLQHTPARARRAARRLREEGIEPTYQHDWKHLCGTLYEMPIEQPADVLIQAADRAVAHAQMVRATHGRKTERGSHQRKTDLRLALARITDAMRPIRRRMARLAYEPHNRAALAAASQALQRERRKLWKMSQPRKRRN